MQACSLTIIVVTLLVIVCHENDRAFFVVPFWFACLVLWVVSSRRLTQAMAVVERVHTVNPLVYQSLSHLLLIRCCHEVVPFWLHVRRWTAYHCHLTLLCCLNLCMQAVGPLLRCASLLVLDLVQRSNGCLSLLRQRILLDQLGVRNLISLHGLSSLWLFLDMMDR